MADDERLLDLLDSWQLAVAEGRAPTAAELCGERSDLVAALQEWIAILQRFEQLGVSATTLTASEPSAPTTVDQPASVPDETVRHESKVRTATPVGVSTTGDAPAPEVRGTFAGFRLLGVLGEGGFGIVFRAEDTELRRKVALKILHAQALARPGAQEAFLAEARALAAVQHDHVVPIYQVGRADGQLFLAMPLLGGETLAARLEREGALPPEEVRRIGREVAAGLGAIHAKGLVHRDLKPGNVWLEAGGSRVKILDLGIAHDPLATVGGLTGTPPYMSPEQAEGRELDLRSDLFSLGTVLYECASGRRPFDSPSLNDTLRSVREQQPAPLVRINPGVPADIGTLIERLHRKDPADRPASAAEVETLLRDGDRPGQPSTVPQPARATMARRGLLVAVAGILLVPSIAYLTWPSGRPMDKATVENKPAPPPVTPDPLRVRSLDVKRYAALNKNDVQGRGILGKQSFGASLGDEFEVRAYLSRPAYAFLVVFRPDGKDEVLYPQDENEPPSKTDAPVYPSMRREDRYVMEEGAGLWLITLVASDEPLPSYRAWRAGHPGSPWKPAPGKPGRVWYDDGQSLDTLEKDVPPVRGTRGGKSAADKVPVVRVVDWLRDESKGTVSAVAFTVEAKP